MLGVKLDNVIINGMKIHANKPMFERTRATKEEKGVEGRYHRLKLMRKDRPRIQQIFYTKNHINDFKYAGSGGGSISFAEVVREGRKETSLKVPNLLSSTSDPISNTSSFDSFVEDYCVDPLVFSLATDKEGAAFEADLEDIVLAGNDSRVDVERELKVGTIIVKVKRKFFKRLDCINGPLLHKSKPINLIT